MASDQQWHEHLQKEQREWEEAKTLLKELREDLAVKTPKASVLTSEVGDWGELTNMLQGKSGSKLLRRAQSFSKIADLDSEAICNMFLLEPIKIDTSKLTGNLESLLNITIVEDEVPSVLTKLGFERKAKGWVLSAPHLCNVTALDLNVLKS